jgi:predicted permease
MFPRLGSFWQSISKCSAFERNLDDEMRFHLESRTEDLVRSGLSREEANRRARIEFGCLEAYQDRCRDSRQLNCFEDLVQDFRFGLRILRKSPGFTATLALILSVGIGGTTAMYSIVRGVLLRPLPFARSNELAIIWGLTDLGQVDRLAYWAHNAAFDQLAQCELGGVNLTAGDRTERVSAAVVSATFFPVLEAQPAIGREFLQEEEVAGRNHVAILSHAFWVANFAGNPSIFGKTIRLNGIPHIVVGVMPRGFDFPGQVQVWVPRVPRLGKGQLELGNNPTGISGSRLDFGRLKQGVTPAEASEIMSALSRRLQKQFGDERYMVANDFVKVHPLQESIVGHVRTPLLTLLGAVFFLLLIVCANAANMLLARAALRQKEVAVRLCLGATRMRVARQLVTESLAFALVAGGLGIVLSRWFLQIIRAFAPANIPRLADARIDLNVLGLAVALSTVTGVLVGLAPALKSLAPQLTRTLKQEAYRSTGAMHRTLRGALIVGELAISLVLLSGATLMVQSFHRMMQTRLGFTQKKL